MPRFTNLVSPTASEGSPHDETYIGSVHREIPLSPSGLARNDMMAGMETRPTGSDS
jgi:hypothetical protein